MREVEIIAILEFVFGFLLGIIWERHKQRGRRPIHESSAALEGALANVYNTRGAIK